jgi:hypothetical protein
MKAFTKMKSPGLKDVISKAHGAHIKSYHSSCQCKLCCIETLATSTSIHNQHQGIVSNILFMQPSLAYRYCTMIFDNSPPSPKILKLIPTKSTTFACVSTKENSPTHSLIFSTTILSHNQIA